TRGSSDLRGPRGSSCTASSRCAWPGSRWVRGPLRSWPRCWRCRRPSCCRNTSRSGIAGPRCGRSWAIARCRPSTRSWWACSRARASAPACRTCRTSSPRARSWWWCRTWSCPGSCSATRGRRREPDAPGARQAPSAAAEPAAPAVARFLPLAEEGGVVLRLLVGVLLQHVPDVVVVVRHPAAQPRGLHQPPPHHLVGGEVVDRNELAAHY